ncbi:E7 [Eidolon helvum papillomavirus 3]|uniref:Protein E7 n=1 Tax=Eidolon helvum papillomavirus 3 TaxID=1335477 RepID=A0A1P8YVT0_9PAPI|nr:E7 [Eidolon helvum papillomavirus 3]AQA28210.1 E7 [Eidolon helvum papillomavirus 3]
MIGGLPDLAAVAEGDAVTTCDLRCYESLPSEEELEAELHLYRVALDCIQCKAPLSLVLAATHSGIRRLASLLRLEVNIVCSHCSRNR